ncbi:SDR family oxidoreductase [Roseococcus sp. SDR]|uniref:SDR family NAD(P)-dependent oxidoreductase n=1 Tax=Roseococcus sp. SDR TaxID=2835532 RepID=UPI001BCBDCC2|nr:SDR family NAD(P)-dependent oxidoreductase [Roseococcus sp. SDR]MBS7791640.1 SDR family oxidoreductase [Roseococcus sp. SDR]MBV1846954.1 SDR family oxidoreductase [Roseococcus sp. SDR]
MTHDPRRVILVTGAAGNLGRATLACLAQEGATLVAVDRMGDAASLLPPDLPDATAHLALPGLDLLDAASCEAGIARVMARFGRLDGVAHTVGGFAMQPLTEAGPTEWEAMFRLNLLSTLNIFRAAIAAMRPAGRGSLCAVGALAALKAPAEMGAYAASKGAVLRLVESYAEELRGTGLRVNAVLPGTMDTPQNRAAMPGAEPGAWVRPEEVARLIAFLLSDAAGALTGALVPAAGRN